MHMRTLRVASIFCLFAACSDSARTSAVDIYLTDRKFERLVPGRERVDE